MNSVGPASAVPRRGAAFACWCGVLGAFHAALAAGAPWGRAAWGGGHPGVLPGRLRLGSGVAAAVSAGVAAVSVDRLLGGRGRRRVLLGAAVYTSLGTAVNSLSPSRLERAIWTPMSALGAMLALKAWREATPAAE